MNEAKRIFSAGPVLWIIIFAALVASAYNNLSSSQTIQATGSVTAVNVGVFSDQACTQNCTSISLGNISPGQTKTYLAYVKSPGNVPVVLTLGVDNWVPTNASSVLSFSWD